MKRQVLLFVLLAFLVGGAVVFPAILLGSFLERFLNGEEV